MATKDPVVFRTASGKYVDTMLSTDHVLLRATAKALANAYQESIRWIENGERWEATPDEH